jgi:hypothetical protein
MLARPTLTKPPRKDQDDLSAPKIQARNGLPASGAIGTAPLLSPIETPSAPIVATPRTESANQADQQLSVTRSLAVPIGSMWV